MKSYINNCTLYIVLWALYYLQGTLYASGSIMSQGILVLMMALSIYYFIKVNVSCKLPLFLKVLDVFLIVMTIYGILFLLDPNDVIMDNVLSQKIKKIEYFKSLYISLLPIYAMFYFSQKHILTDGFIRVFTIFWLLVTILLFFRKEQEQQALLIAQGMADDVEFTNNIAYDFLHLFPLVFFVNKKPLLQMSLTMIIFAFILMGMKRGAIIIGAICLVWFVYRAIVNASRSQKMIIIISMILLFFVGVNYVMNLYETSIYFNYRVEQTLEGNSSGRDVIYSTLWQHYEEDLSLKRFLLGNGVFYTVTIANKFAHNDWLELLIDQGLLGVTIYVFFFLSLFHVVYANRQNKIVSSVLVMIFIIMLISSFFSMSYSALSLPIAVGLGYCLSKSNVKELSIYEKNNMPY